MESDSRFHLWLTSISDWLNEQAWFQELKTKWEELDPQSRVYLKAATAGGTLLLTLIVVISSIWSVHSLKTELNDKQDLLTMIQSANEELRSLREQTANSPAASGGPSGTWSNYFETVAANSGVDKSSMAVSDEAAGTTTDMAKETLYDVSLKHVSIKQIVRYAFGLESGARPVKLRNLSIDTHADPAGYMDASLSVSAFAMITK